MKKTITMLLCALIGTAGLLFGCKTEKKIIHKVIVQKPTQKVPWRPGHYVYFKRNDTAIVKALSFYPSVKVSIAGAFINGEMHVEDGKLLDNDSVKNVYKTVDTSRSGRLAVPFSHLSGPMGQMTITYSVKDKTYELRFHAERRLLKRPSGRVVADTVFVLNRTARLFYDNKYQYTTVQTENNQRCILLFYDLHNVLSDDVQDEAEGLEGGNTSPKTKH